MPRTNKVCDLLHSQNLEVVCRIYLRLTILAKYLTTLGIKMAVIKNENVWTFACDMFAKCIRKLDMADWVCRVIFMRSPHCMFYFVLFGWVLFQPSYNSYR